jgi:large subunit ribosomal protein L1
MAKPSKRQKAIREKIDAEKLYAADEAFALMKELATVKFSESVDVAINLGVDPRKSDQVVRGSCLLPNGTGKSVRVAVFAQGPAAEAAVEAGAEKVGMDDLAEEVKAGNMDFDVVIAAPDAMRVVGQLGQILGPRGLMPNPKVGTVTPDVGQAVKNAKSGQARFRTDKGGIVHASIGSVSFEPAALQQNLEALIRDLQKLKPSSAKGIYLKRITVSSTMGPGLSLDQASLAIG